MAPLNRDAAPSELSRVSRRFFVGSIPLLVVGLADCTGALLDRTRFAESFIVDPDWTAYRPVLRGLIRVVIPLDEPAFARLPIETIEARLVSMFPLEKEQKFLGLQRTLTLFDQADLFPIVSGPLLLEEEKARDGRGGAGANGLATTLQDADRRAWKELAHTRTIDGSARFSTMSLESQRAYFLLWRDSPSVVKRAFHSTIRSLVMMTVYSADEVWPAIGYAGPLVPRGGKGR